jgi:hypothetical protein
MRTAPVLAGINAVTGVTPLLKQGLALGLLGTSRKNGSRQGCGQRPDQS